jgi:hypothetical protein
LICLFCIPGVSSLASPSIIFVHIGSCFPSYLYDAVGQALLFNPTSTIYVIGNEQAFETQKYPLNVTPVTCESLKPSNEHLQFLKTSTLNKSFRNGFWRKATERFFYLYECIKAYQLTDVFHFEYDNLIYVDLEHLLPIFQKQYKTIGAIFDTQERCVPNCMFIPHVNALYPLISFMSVQASRGMNDMNCIGLFRCLNQDKIASLPVIPEGKDLFQKQVQEPEFFWHNIEWFDSIFDGAAMGQFLGGIDPRNGPSSSGFVNQDAVYDVSRFDIRWELDEYQRKVPYLMYHGRKYPINNLHIHSKQLHRFRS